MALRLLNQSKQIFFNVLSRTTTTSGSRNLSHYPVDDSIFGLNEDQQQVMNFEPMNQFKFNCFRFSAYIIVETNCF